MAGPPRQRRSRLRRRRASAQEGVELGGGDSVALGLAVGALTYYLADRAVERWASLSASDRPPLRRRPRRPGLRSLGAFLDGIPEQMVLRIGLAAGGSVSVSVAVAAGLSSAS